MTRMKDGKIEVGRFTMISFGGKSSVDQLPININPNPNSIQVPHGLAKDNLCGCEANFLSLARCAS